jgi:hypothetical protein
MDPRLYDATAIASGFVPGSGLMDFIGQAPAIGGGMGPSFMENLKKKQYIDAMLQMAGAAGDAMMVVPPVGMTVKAATTAGKTARAGSKAADALTAAKKAKPVEAPAVITEPKSNYLVNTPKNPNPLVGTRYETELIPGTQAERRDFNLDDLLGASLMTYPTDMLSRNVRIKNVSGIPIDNPAVSVGGLTYMSDLENMKNLIAYASNKSASTSQNNRSLKAIEENLARGGTGRVFMAPHTMPRGGENFSTTPTEGLLSIIDTVGMRPDLASELSDRIRGATVKGVKGKYNDFVGIGDSGLIQQLMTGEGLKAGSPGDLRKVFVDKLSSVAAEKGLGFNYQDLQNAMLDQNVMNKPAFWMGDSIYEALPKLGTSKGTHPAYSHNMPGIFRGNTPGAHISDVMGDVYRRAVQENMNKPGSRPGTFADADQLARGSLSTAGENISLFIDEKELARLKRLFGPR